MRTDFRQVDEKIIQANQTVELYERAIAALDAVGWRKYVKAELSLVDCVVAGQSTGKVAVTSGLCIMEALAVASEGERDNWVAFEVPNSLYVAVVEAAPSVGRLSFHLAARVAFYNDEYCSGGEEAKRIFRRAIELETVAV